MQQARASPPPGIQALYAEALNRMEQLLGEPDVVDQAHAHLTTLIRRIVLTPDPEAPHGLAAEILTDLGRLLSAAGQANMLAERFTDRMELTVGRGAPPPPLLCVVIQSDLPVSAGLSDGIGRKSPGYPVRSVPVRQRWRRAPPSW